MARAAGRSLSEDTVRGLEETLRAALADEEAASLLLAGRLTDGAAHFRVRHRLRTGQRVDVPM